MTILCVDDILSLLWARLLIRPMLLHGIQQLATAWNHNPLFYLECLFSNNIWFTTMLLHGLTILYLGVHLFLHTLGTLDELLVSYCLDSNFLYLPLLRIYFIFPHN